MNQATRDQLAKDLDALMAWNGADAFQWNSKSVPVLASRLALSDAMGEGGLWENYAGKLIASLRSFQTEGPPGTWTTGALPNTGSRIVFRGKMYTVERVIVDDGVMTVTIYLSHFGKPQVK
jgi:hypothetical protein